MHVQQNNYPPGATPTFCLQALWQVKVQLNKLEFRMSEAAVDKTLFAFLNGLAKRLYFKELEFSDEFLRNDVLGGISEEGEHALSSLGGRGQT